MERNKDLYIMKKITFLFLLSLIYFLGIAATNTSIAATAISDEFANSFYGNCLNKPDPNISTETQDIFCQCAAMHMQKFLTIEDMQQMSSPDPHRARMAANKILLDVYAPCMEFPVRDLLFNTCRKRGAPAAACECLAREMGKYTSQSAQQTLYDIIQKQPYITDPLGPIVNSPNFKAKEQAVAQECAKSLMP